MNKKERIARFALSRIDGIGASTFHSILSKFKSIDRFLQNFDGNFKEQIPFNIFQKLNGYSSLNINKDLDILKKKGINFIVFGESVYPTLLAQSTNPPPCVYYKGSYDKNIFDRSLSIVGTRRMSEYGKMVTKKIVSNLVDKGFTVVSGMAYGIDCKAHRECLNSKGKTVAVLASSVDEPTPRGNTQIYKEILRNKGLIISELFPNGKIGPWSFPVRNRIIASSSLGTLIIEAGKKSGALITANIAFSENRLVFAIPGNIDRPMSQGTNKLIKQSKAKLVENVEDILVEFNYLSIKPKSIKKNVGFEKDKKLNNLNLSKRQRKIIELLSKKPLGIDQLCLKFKIKYVEIISILSSLEVEKILSKGSDGKYRVVL